MKTSLIYCPIITGKPYYLILENNYLLFIIEPLTNQKVLGIETNDWLYKKEDLKYLFKYSEPLIRNLSRSN